MSLPTVTFENAVKIMRDVVAEFGTDHVNKAIDGSCMYFNPETAVPECGVGQLLSRVGITQETFSPFENHTAIRALMQVREDAGTPFVVMDERTVRSLDSFQAQQDSSNTWGNSLTTALARDEALYGDPS